MTQYHHPSAGIFNPIGKTGPLLICLCILAACTKESDEPAFALEPSIQLEKVSQDSVVEFEESLVIYLSYKDGDGDLGNPDPDINSIFVKDSRLPQADAYYLAPLAPENVKISIQGSLALKLSPTFILGNASRETTRFTIHMVDRAGNKSNPIETNDILILRKP